MPSSTGNTPWVTQNESICVEMGEQSGNDDNITFDAKTVAMVEKHIVQQVSSTGLDSEWQAFRFIET